MERERSLTRAAAAAAAVLALAAGCTSPGKPGSWSSFSLFSKPPEMPQPTRPVVDVPDGGVRQASATVPAGPTFAGLSFAKLTGRAEKPAAASTMTVIWEPRLAYLPDPSKNGVMGGGLTGNMFLFGPGDVATAPNGKLTVDLYDESPRLGGNPGKLKERWEIDKETLKKLATTHEMFGRNYLLFLPWPSYRPDVTRVRLAVRYDPEQGHPLFAESPLTIDTSAPAGAPVWNGSTQTWIPGQNAPPPSLLPPGMVPGPTPPQGGLPPTAGGVMPSAGFGPPTTGMVPAGGPQPPPGVGPTAIPLLPPPGTMQVPPGGLPSIVITPQMRGQ
jgi:hypothetical protein